ncbi:MAG: response regulator [Sphingomicrobium sp.]
MDYGPGQIGGTGMLWDSLSQLKARKGSMSAKILIVEDEMLVAMELESILEDLGHTPVGIAPDLKAADDYARLPLDLALVDLNLRDGLTGPEIGKRLGERGVSVLFITANPRVLGDGVAGTVGVLTKPTDQDTVRAAVDYALQLRSGIQDVTPPAALKLFG